MRATRGASLVCLVVSFALLSAPVVDAASLQLSYRLSGSDLRASVTGPSRSAVWRIRIVAPGREQRTDFVLETGDVNWLGVIRIWRRSAGEWVVARRINLDRALGGRERLRGCAAGICWDTARLRLPRDGDARFGITVRLTRSGDYRLVGAVKLAREAFIFGPWISSKRVVIQH